MKQAIEKAIFALQRVAMAHRGSDEHSRDMYRTAEEARTGLVKALSDAECFERLSGGTNASQ